MSQITGISTVCSTNSLDSLERKHQSPHYWALSYHSDLTLSQELQPMAAQFWKKAGPPLVKILATSSCRSSKTGPWPLVGLDWWIPMPWRHHDTRQPRCIGWNTLHLWAMVIWIGQRPTAIGHYGGCRCPSQYISNNLADSIIIVVSHSICILTVSINKPG